MVKLKASYAKKVIIPHAAQPYNEHAHTDTDTDRVRVRDKV